MAAAITYGIVHDQFTARLCVEYFTVPPAAVSHDFADDPWAFAGASPRRCVGAFCAVLAVVSQSKGRWRFAFGESSIDLCLLAVMGISAAAAGFLGLQLSQRLLVSVPASMAHLIPPGSTVALWPFGSLTEQVMSLGLSVVTYHSAIMARKRQAAVLTIFPNTRGAIIRSLILAAVAGAIFGSPCVDRNV